MPQDTKAPFSKGILFPCFSGGKKLKLFENPLFKRNSDFIILRNIPTSFCNYKQASLHYLFLLWACFSKTQFLLYHLQEDFGVMRWGSAITIFQCDRRKYNCVF